MVLTFDLFGTLVSVVRPGDPAGALATALREHDVVVPGDWAAAYAESHVDLSRGRECGLAEHVEAALASRGVDADSDAVTEAVVEAFTPDRVETRPGAVDAVSAAAARGPVGVLSNCAVPGLVERTLAASDLDPDAFDAVVASVDLGWRKPHDRAFEAAAERLGATPDHLVHVGDDARTDGGVRSVGGRFVDVTETPLSALPRLLEGEP